MEKTVLFPELEAEMARHGDRLEELANVLERSIPAVSRRMNGAVPWSIHDIDAICRYYNKSYEELFKGA